jgi:hypothetical protein
MINLLNSLIALIIGIVLLVVPGALVLVASLYFLGRFIAKKVRKS